MRTMKELWEADCLKQLAAVDEATRALTHSTFVSGGLAALSLIAKAARDALDEKRDVTVAVGDVLHRIGVELKSTSDALQARAVSAAAVDQAQGS